MRRTIVPCTPIARVKDPPHTPALLASTRTTRYTLRMIAVVVNCVAIIAGSLLGLLFCKKITGELSDVVSAAAGIVTLVIGVQMALGYQNIIVLALALIVGGICGTALDIDGKILSVGRFLSRKFQNGTKHAKVSPLKDEATQNRSFGTDVKAAPLPSNFSQESSFGGAAVGAAVAPNANVTQEQSPQSPHIESKQNFAYAFLNASVLFCVGAMAIIGSFKAGTEHDYTIIFTKSILDGFMAIVFAAAMGAGTLFSALSVLVYQGLLTAASSWLSPLITDAMMSEISSSGGALLIMIGINLLNIRTLKTANYLPAIVLAPLFGALASFVQTVL